MLSFHLKAFEEDDFGTTEGIPTRQGIVDILLEIMVGDRKSFTVSWSTKPPSHCRNYNHFKTISDPCAYHIEWYQCCETCAWLTFVEGTFVMWLFLITRGHVIWCNDCYRPLRLVHCLPSWLGILSDIKASFMLTSVSTIRCVMHCVTMYVMECVHMCVTGSRVLNQPWWNCPTLWTRTCKQWNLRISWITCTWQKSNCDDFWCMMYS